MGLKTLTISNLTEAALYVSIEPIAEGYNLEKNEKLELVGEFNLIGDGLVDIVVGCDNAISVYVPEDTLIMKDGKKIGPPE